MVTDGVKTDGTSNLAAPAAAAVAARMAASIRVTSHATPVFPSSAPSASSPPSMSLRICSLSASQPGQPRTVLHAAPGKDRLRLESVDHAFMDSQVPESATTLTLRRGRKAPKPGRCGLCRASGPKVQFRVKTTKPKARIGDDATGGDANMKKELSCAKNVAADSWESFLTRLKLPELVRRMARVAAACKEDYRCAECAEQHRVLQHTGVEADSKPH